MLYLVRHASSSQPLLRPPGDLTPASPDEWRLDHGLSERGVREAAALRLRFDALDPPDRALSSPRQRTVETATFALAGRVPLAQDERLHEWHAGESMEALLARARWLLRVGDEGVSFVFTHGGFIRAVLAALAVGDDEARFGPTFHDFRRVLHVWNASVTLVGHGAHGLELFAVNLCPDVEAISGRR